MIRSSEIIVSTTSSLDGVKILKHLKPVSAHIVAGTNIFSDFLGGFSDIFGGRSQSYQKQLTSIYDEAIEKIQYAAYELGGNCVLGLKIDIDEISGKGKSMFMITAVGTAFIVEKEKIQKSKEDTNIDSSKISSEKISNLKERKDLIEKTKARQLSLTDETWKFIIDNKIEEIFPELYNKFAEIILNPHRYPETEVRDFISKFKSYINYLPREIQTELLYQKIENEEEVKVNLEIQKIIKEFKLLDYNKTQNLIENSDFDRQKMGVKISTFDKPFYDINDVPELIKLKTLINNNFPERGNKTVKKQLLSSKEIEVWECECGKSNNIEYIYCNSCNKNMYGFYKHEINPEDAEKCIEEKIGFIQDLVR